jgi:hypothetical protein
MPCYGAVFFLTVSSSEAKVLKVTCTPGKGLNASIIKLKPGDVLAVTGTCDENVVIPPSAYLHRWPTTAIINSIDRVTTLTVAGNSKSRYRRDKRHTDSRQLGDYGRIIIDG